MYFFRLGLNIYILLGCAIIQVPEMMISFHAFIIECLVSLQANTKKKHRTISDFAYNFIRTVKRPFILQSSDKEEKIHKSYKYLERRELEEKFKKINQSILEMESRFVIQVEELNNKLDQIMQYIKV